MSLSDRFSNSSKDLNFYSLSFSYSSTYSVFSSYAYIYESFSLIVKYNSSFSAANFSNFSTNWLICNYWFFTIFSNSNNPIYIFFYPIDKYFFLINSFSIRCFSFSNSIIFCIWIVLSSSLLIFNNSFFSCFCLFGF